MRIEVGKKYLSRCGRTEWITKVSEADPNILVAWSGRQFIASSGQCIFRGKFHKNGLNDLVSEVTLNQIADHILSL